MDNCTEMATDPMEKESLDSRSDNRSGVIGDNMVIEIILSMLMASEPPVFQKDIHVIELSKVYHHVSEDVCLGVELTVKDQEWIEMPPMRDIEIHRYEVVDIKPDQLIELYCLIHEKYEHLKFSEPEH